MLRFPIAVNWKTVRWDRLVLSWRYNSLSYQMKSRTQTVVIKKKIPKFRLNILLLADLKAAAFFRESMIIIFCDDFHENTLIYIWKKDLRKDGGRIRVRMIATRSRNPSRFPTWLGNCMKQGPDDRHSVAYRTWLLDLTWYLDIWIWSEWLDSAVQKRLWDRKLKTEIYRFAQDSSSKKVYLSHQLSVFVTTLGYCWPTRAGTEIIPSRHPSVIFTYCTVRYPAHSVLWIQSSSSTISEASFPRYNTGVRFWSAVRTAIKK